jgi:1-acyl-sn-glycerol-3-phosphate acyltransferase
MRLTKALLRALVRHAVLLLCRTRVEVREESWRQLRVGGCLVICNHASLLDGVLLAAGSPVPLAFTSERAMSIENAWTSRGMRVLAWLGFGEVIPLDQGAPLALRQVLKKLRDGGNVVIFPDGRITGATEIVAPLPGSQWLIERSGCRVVRARITGAERHRFFAKTGKEAFPEIRVTL